MSEDDYKIHLWQEDRGWCYTIRKGGTPYSYTIGEAWTVQKIRWRPTRKWALRRARREVANICAYKQYRANQEAAIRSAEKL